MKTYELETMDAKQVASLAADLSENNEVIVETAGFIPLEVKFKQFEQNGIINQLRSSDFTSSDYRELYLHPDFDVTPEDDIEEISEKLDSLREYQQEYIKKIAASKDLQQKAGQKKETAKTDDEQKPVEQPKEKKE